MAKTRISELAKELGVTSKAILEKLGIEGFADQYNKPSQGIPLGLAETARTEWFVRSSSIVATDDAQETDVADAEKADGMSASEGGSTATLTKPKITSKIGKKKPAGSKSASTDASADGQSDGLAGTEGDLESDAVAASAGSAVSDHVSATPGAKLEKDSTPSTSTVHEGHSPVVEIDQPAASPAISAASSAGTISGDTSHPPGASPAQPTEIHAPANQAAVQSNLVDLDSSSGASGGAAATGPASEVVSPTISNPVSAPTGPVSLNRGTRPAVTLPAGTNPTAGGQGMGTGGGRGGVPAPQMRPTISLDSRASRPSVTPAPQLVALEKTVMKGPRLVREEKPDMVPTPRPRMRPDGSGGGVSGPGRPGAPGVARPPIGGRGVRAVGTVDAPPSGTEETEEQRKKKAATAVRGRRDLDGRRGEAEAKLREFTEADLIERADRLRSAAVYRSGMDSHLRKSGRMGQGQAARTAAQTGEPIEISEPITIRTLSSSLGVKSTDIMARLMKQKIFATVNQALDTATAQMIGLEFGVEVIVKPAPTLEEQLISEFGAFNSSDASKLTPRSPVVTILGHVDHGKTSLLDKIRSSNVAAGEAGGITQHIAAFSVAIDRGGEKKRVTFIDTPGHQAFTAMRARGANMTDVVVLVIDAAQGIQPQTVESINHARAAGVPIVVAMNKIDLPEASPDKILGQLAANDLNPVEWGGQVEVIRTSARTGVGIEDLIEILDLQAEILELKADASAPARGIVVEARIDPGLGSVATVLVQNGTLKLGDVILAGGGYGRVRQLVDSYGKTMKSAGPSTPVLVSGFGQIPAAGDKFFCIDDLDRAKSIAAERQLLSRQTDLAVSNRVSLDSLFAASRDEKIKTINLIIKADVQGSMETLQKTITDQNTDEVRVKVIHAAVGAINESDVELATASEAVIIGFHVVPDEKAQSLAEARHVEVRTYRVIYEIFDDLKKAMSGMLAPEVREKHHGWVEVREVFKVSRVGNVAGCYVTEGHISRGSKVRLVRDGIVVNEGMSIDTLRRIKEDVKEVKMGFECGIKVANFDDIKKGDKLEAYIREEFKRTL